jgi:ATP-dependent helicase/DNAse subunit B
MPYVIQITCYSFTENEISFQKFLEVFKQGMKLYFNDLILFHFQDLMQRILDETKRMAPKFFGNLDYATTILERSFALLG